MSSLSDGLWFLPVSRALSPALVSSLPLFVGTLADCDVFLLHVILLPSKHINQVSINLQGLLLSHLPSVDAVELELVVGAWEVLLEFKTLS